MTTYVRRAILQVYMDGRVEKQVVSARASHGYQQDYGEAEVLCTAAMSHDVGTWSRINILMGIAGEGAFHRFAGFAWAFDTDLYPNMVKITCRGDLARATITHPSPNPLDVGGMTSEEMIDTYLDSSGVQPGDKGIIQGSGVALGTTVDPSSDKRFTWQQKQTAMDKIKELDRTDLGYRTQDTPGGQIVRIPTSLIASDDYVATFTEGVDFFTATSTIEQKKPSDIIVTNAPILLPFEYTTPSDLQPPGMTIVRRTFSPLIESRLISDGVGLSLEAVAQWHGNQWSTHKLTFQATTHRNDYLAPGETVRLYAPTRLGFLNINVLLQAVSTEVDEKGAFTQTLTCVAELPVGGDTGGSVFPVNNIPGGPSALSNPATTAPAETILASFAVISIAQEKVIIADAVEDLYVVYCEDTSYSTYGPALDGTGRTWTASAGGVPATGTGKTFVVAFQDLGSASITLEVTSLSAATGTVTKDMANFRDTLGVKKRKLYTAASDVMEAFTGDAWNIDAPSSGIVVAAGNGPIAGTGTPYDNPGCVPGGGGGGGPALFFIRGSWLALLGDGTWEDRGTESLFGTSAVNAWADSELIVTTIAMENDFPPVYHRFESTDGALTFNDTSTGVITGGQGINSLLLPFRDGMFRVLVFEDPGGTQDGLVGGEYASADGSSWARTGRALPRVFPGGTTVANCDGWCATSEHAYYLVDTMPDGGGLALLVDDEASTPGVPEVQRIFRVGTVTGGTYTIQVGSLTSSSINVSDSAATVLSILNALDSFGPGGSASGSIAGDDLEITFPYNGPQELMIINDFGVAGGGSLDVDRSTTGVLGIPFIAGHGPDGPAGMFGAIEADVAMILTSDVSFNRYIEKHIGTAAAVDATPSFLTADDSVDRLISRDGDTWVGMMFDNSVGFMRLIVTHDQGATWAKVGPVGPGVTGFFARNEIASDPVTPGKWWAVLADPSVWTSEDDGDTWTQVGDPPFGSGTPIPLGGKSY